jgi:hypothetical protein
VKGRKLPDVTLREPFCCAEEGPALALSAGEDEIGAGLRFSLHIPEAFPTADRRTRRVFFESLSLSRS